LEPYIQVRILVSQFDNYPLMMNNYH
jgi:hypothetical protein